MSFPRYDEYKDSGVEWLGDVPAHWRLTPLKWLANIQNGADHKPIEQDDGYPVYGSGGVFAFASDYLYDGESVLLGRKGTIDKPLYVSGRFWTVDTMYWTKIVRDANPRFVYYAATTIPFDYYSTSTALPSMTKGTLGMHFVAAPPLPEQTAIAAFLDRETAKIDDLVAEQQNLIALLKEKRQALISHAVTKGLNPNAPMKDSGVEWLGEVPAHWQTYRLAALFEEIAEAGEDDLPILSVSIHSGVSDDEMSEDELERKVSRSDDRTKYKRVQPGDLVYNMMRAWQGGFGTVTVEGMVSPAYVVARPTQTLQTEFVEMQLRSPSAVEEMRRHSRGVTDFRLRLYWDEFKTLQIALPTPEEQIDITRLLGTETEKIDALMTEVHSSIALLQERRTALIAAAVTGKLSL